MLCSMIKEIICQYYSVLLEVLASVNLPQETTCAFSLKGSPLRHMK